MRLIRLLYNHSRGAVLLAAMASIASGVLNAGILALLNNVLGTSERTLNQAALYFALLILVFVLRLVAEVLLVSLAQGTIFKLRMQLSRRILGVELRHLEDVGAHRILSSLTDDIPMLALSINSLPILCFNITVIFSCLTYLFILAPKIFLLVGGFLVLGVTGYQYALIKSKGYLFAARRTNDVLYGHFQAIIHGIKELKLHGRRREEFLESVVEPCAQEYKEQNIAGTKIWVTAAAAGSLLSFIVIGLILFALPVLDPSWLGSAVMGGYVLVFLYMMQPLQFVMNNMPNLARADIALERTEQLGFDLSTGQSPSGTLETPSRWKSLELAAVTHSYRIEDDQDFVLGPVDLEIEAGEIVFLIGGNGSGKTTLAKLILGLYLPDDGEIRLDGQAISSERLESYREHFSAIFADFFLFEELLGIDSSHVDDKARDYLRRLRLDHKVKIEDGTLSTTKLSQGQRKRLALLTAFLEDRSIYLFDEWAADQDPVFKEFFYYAILPELKSRGKTVIAITHDDTYFDAADRVIKMRDGVIESIEQPVREGAA